MRTIKDIDQPDTSKTHVITCFEPGYSDKYIFAVWVWSPHRKEYCMADSSPVNCSWEALKEHNGHFVVVDVVTYEEIRPIFYPDC